MGAYIPCILMVMARVEAVRMCVRTVYFDGHGQSGGSKDVGVRTMYFDGHGQ